MTGDFVSMVYRVMPHANEPERMARKLEAMQLIKATPLSEFQGAAAPQAVAIALPDFGRNDYDVFEDNFLDDALMIHQERAYTSPIWYTP
jgi:hypothetical protein